MIGYETLQQLQAKINTSENTLEIATHKIQMQRKYPNSRYIQINGNESRILTINVTSENGPFIIENDLEIAPKIYILSGLYESNNNMAKVVVSNLNQNSDTIELTPLQFDINNFELKTEINDLQNIDRSNNFNDQNPLSQIRTDHLNYEEKIKLIRMLDNYKKVFYMEGQNLTFTNAIKHSIITKDDLPIHAKSYRYPYCHRDEVQRQVLKMLEQGIIRHSNSPWSSPIWIVPKKLDASGQKKWRLVVDYRKLNEKTVDDRYPIPNITDILDKLGRCMYFTTLDLASGFHQIEVNAKDIQKTAFNVENGHYEFVRMPFGLKNAPSTFQRVMDNVLREHIGVRCFVYMDDIIVFSTSLQEHLTNLSKILETLEKYNLKVQLDKSEFLQKEVAFLGHVVTPEGVKPNPSKISVIKEWPLPSNEKDLRGFLGILGYYRKFIRDFAKIAKPLTNALRKDASITHSKEFVEAFEKCKSILSSNDILQYPDFSKKFVLTTDASNYAIGAVLSQGPIGSDKPIAFASRTLNKSEEKYSAIEKELLAVVWACKYFRPYLYGTEFTLYTDHKPLTYGLNLKNTNHRLVHWQLALNEFKFEIRYRPGKQNVVADSLSRVRQELNLNEEDLPAPSQENSSSDDATVHSADTDDSEFIPCTEKAVNEFSNQIILKIGPNEQNDYETIFPRVYRRTITKFNFGVPAIFKMLKEYMDPKRTNCIYCPENLIGIIQTVYKNYFSRCKNFKIYISQKLLIDLQTLEEQELTIEQTHNTAHRGIWENKIQISKRFFFPRMKHKITKFLKLCQICNKNKYDRHPFKTTLGITPESSKPLEILHIDLFISQPIIFISALDKFSRFGILIPIKSRTIVDIRKGLLKLFAQYGSPQRIVCDNEPALKSAEIRGILRNLNIDVHYTPPNHSKSNGSVERFHSTLLEIYRCTKEEYQEHEDLSKKELFRISCTLYNNTVHSVTKLKPREIFLGLRDGEDRPLNIDSIIENRNKLFDDIILTNRETQSKNITFHNKKRSEPPLVTEGQTVFKKVQDIRKKTNPKFTPITVAEDKGRTFLDDTGHITHKENMKNI